MRLGKGFALLFTDLAAYAICVLILVSADRSGLERMSTAEQYTYIGMRSRLILTGEVKIDIRLLIAVESEERLERDILSVRNELFAAFRTVLRRQVITRTVYTRIIKFCVIALWTSVMRRQRVNF